MLLVQTFLGLFMSLTMQSSTKVRRSQANARAAALTLSNSQTAVFDVLRHAATESQVFHEAKLQMTNVVVEGTMVSGVVVSSCK